MHSDQNFVLVFLFFAPTTNTCTTTSTSITTTTSTTTTTTTSTSTSTTTTTTTTTTPLKVYRSLSHHTSERCALCTDAAGETVLYFGCRNKGSDDIYADELADFIKIGALTNLQVAYSRDQEEKVFVALVPSFWLICLLSLRCCTPSTTQLDNFETGTDCHCLKRAVWLLLSNMPVFFR